MQSHHMLDTLASMQMCVCVPACCVCTTILATLSNCVCLCVCVRHSICACAGLVAEQNETKQSRADLHYHPQAGRCSLSLCSVTCWSSYNYSSHTHPSQYCCGVRRAHSFSGSAALHKETITESKQAPSTRGGRRDGWETKSRT